MLASPLGFSAMLSRFLSNHTALPVAVEPVPTVFPKIEGADIAAVFVGKRVAGDFYDSIRVSSERVLIGMLAKASTTTLSPLRLWDSPPSGSIALRPAQA